MRSAEAWLPKSGNSESKRHPRGKAPKRGRDPAPAPEPIEPIDDEALEWLPGGNGASAGRSRRHSARKSRASLNGVRRETDASSNGSRSELRSQASEAERLAELQKVEIEVLVKRVEELESELSAARKDAANAKRQATRANKAASKAVEARRSGKSRGSS